MRPEIPSSSHAKLSASSAERWTVCPGSIRTSEGMPNSSSYYAAEGTYAHHIASTCLEHPEFRKGKGDTPENWLGSITVVEGHEIECTQDMVDAVNDYLSEIRDYLQDDDVLMVEVSLTPALKELHPSFGGTSDCIIYRPSTKHLRVYDYKHGAGVMVEVKDNKQLKYYGVGALLTLNLPAETVQVTVVQPRCGSGETIRSDSFPAVDLIEFIADLQDAATATESPDSPLVPGDHCRWCPGAVKCPELEKRQLALMASDFDIIGEFAPVMSPEKLAEALAILPMVEARISQIRELAYNEGLNGNPPPGYKIVDKRAIRKWKKESEAQVWAEIVLGDKALTEPELKSPAQIEKLLPKGERDALADFVEKISSGYTLVPVSDKRPAALLASPEDFDVVT